MYIALCDDDQTTLKELKTYVSAHFAATAYTVQIDFFSRVEDFLNCRQTYDIVFMDIYYDGMNGMDAVKYMQRTENCQIVFSTASREYAVEAFAVDAAHYLVKPLTQAKVSDALDRCLKRMNRISERILEIKTRNATIPIPMANIIYIEVFNKISVIHTTGNTLQTYTSLDALFEALGPHMFMRAQRSYIVNMKFIDSFFYDHILLQNGLEIKLSRNNRSILKTQYQNFLFDLARKGEL